MFRTFARKFLPNPLDWKLKKAAKKQAKTVLICWNRGLGDIPLGVFAIIHRVRHYLPDCKITILTRENLKDGFSLLPNLEIIVDPRWQRDKPIDLSAVDASCYDLILEKPLPNDWCQWQLKKLTPRLSWSAANERPFDLPDGFIYIGVQAVAETTYALWRNWPKERWDELFTRLSAIGNVRVLLFGYGQDPEFSHPNVIDLRGKTSFFEMMSIIKNRCSAMVLPDSGVLAMTYFLDVNFPIKVVSLFADPTLGILKQGVASPNVELVHTCLIAENRDLSRVTAEQVFAALFPKKVEQPLLQCVFAEEVTPIPFERAACVILAGGQGTRLGLEEPKGLYEVLNRPLFLHHLDKIPTTTPVAVMTSTLNHEQTVSFFEKQERKVDFFQQEMISLLDQKFQAVGLGPNGNGSVYKQLVSSGLLDQYEQAGIDTLILSPVDNPLTDPADARLLAYHRQTGAEVTIKCIERKRGESMGALTETGIVEYLDIERDIFLYSYVGQVALSTQFIRRAADLNLPYHWVLKKGLWKREQFLFDAFPKAKKIKALCYPRALCYGPIKGPESKSIVEKMLLERE